jgi:hypothetical protein
MMKRATFGLVSVTSLFLSLAQASADIVYQDGFEAPTLDPFWSTILQSGSITLSTAMAHSGQQSAQFTSVDTGQLKDLYLFHDFATPLYGTVSVWFFDTGAGQPSSNYVGLELDMSHTDFRPRLYASDYDLPGNGDTYNWGMNSQAAYASSVPRTGAWHEFTIEDTAQSLALLVDGTIVHTESGGTPFDHVQIWTGGPSWRPAWTYYVDDFSLVGSAVPEPSTLAIGGIGTVILLGWASRRRRMVR